MLQRKRCVSSLRALAASRPHGVPTPASSPVPRFDLGSILTRAPSMWHPCDPVPPGSVASGSDDEGSAAASSSAVAPLDPYAPPAGWALASSESDAEGWLSATSSVDEEGGYAAPKSRGAMVCEAGCVTSRVALGAWSYYSSLLLPATDLPWCCWYLGGTRAPTGCSANPHATLAAPPAKAVRPLTLLYPAPSPPHAPPCPPQFHD